MVTAHVAPFFSVPPHVECPVGPLYVWFTEPPGVVLQLMEAVRFTTEIARWLIGPGLDLLAQRYDEATRFTIVFDIRQMTGRDPVVRSLFMDLAREQAGRFEAIVAIPPLQINPVYLAGLHAAAALVSAFGPRFEISGDVAHVIYRHRLRPAG